MNKQEYSRDFKRMVVRQVENGEERPVQACREYGLAHSMLDRWRNEYRARGEVAFTVKTSSPEVSLEARVAELERLCGQPTLEKGSAHPNLRACFEMGRCDTSACQRINYLTTYDHWGQCLGEQAQP